MHYVPTLSCSRLVCTSATTLISRPKYLGHKQAIPATGLGENLSNRPNLELCESYMSSNPPLYCIL